MKVLFTHDHKFYKDEKGLYYSDGQYPYRLWRRYLEVFDEIVVAARVRSLGKTEERQYLDLSSGPKVRFVEIPSVSSPLAWLGARQEAVKRLSDALVQCDGLIARIGEISRLAAPLARKQKKPWLAEVVYCPFDALWNHGSWQGKLYAPYAYWATRRMVEKAPYALYVTKEFLQRRYPSYGETVSCSDVQLADEAPYVLERRLLRLSLAATPVKKIGLIGTLANHMKGVHVALQALSYLAKDRDDFLFQVLGGGDPAPWQKLAEQYGIGDRTVFCGTLPHGTAVNEWLDQIDLYIQPSFQEGLPRALLEAMGRACPALGSTAGGIPELLPPSCLHKPGDSMALAAGIGAALDNSAWCSNQAKRNFTLAAAYRPSALDPLRQNFWRCFSQAVSKEDFLCQSQPSQWQNGSSF
ncbi:MAG: glycosyltransferase [Sporomusaceae bacterium]|nr:glycosyltransferase [Sporomusaceae bacterium]